MGKVGEIRGKVGKHGEIWGNLEMYGEASIVDDALSRHNNCYDNVRVLQDCSSLSLHRF